jgi:hypothetical protein
MNRRGHLLSVFPASVIVVLKYDHLFAFQVFGKPIPPISSATRIGGGNETDARDIGSHFQRIEPVSILAALGDCDFVCGQQTWKLVGYTPDAVKIVDEIAFTVWSAEPKLLARKTHFLVLHFAGFVPKIVYRLRLTTSLVRRQAGFTQQGGNVLCGDAKRNAAQCHFEVNDTSTNIATVAKPDPLLYVY